ncbi:MAG: phosphoribosylformylglycinamidine cyclo-ligase [Chloroflexi bacterium]|nr:phosphoribosylformylglycinamidine cyclo-ligase [Chloroflexota bacterium]
MTEEATYRQAGVDIEAGDRAVELMKKAVASTKRPEVIGGIGGFGGLFSLPSGYSEPVLVGATDGVGTKLKIAQALDKHDTVGVDLVAMCANDVLVQGAEPLFFLDYLATGKLEPEKAAEVVAGVAEGCRLAGCALLGGETAEMPGCYSPGEYDLAGFAVGIVEKSKLLDGSSLVTGDVLIGIASSGLHSNGYSLVRYLIEKSGASLEDDFGGLSLGEELIKPTKIYVKALLPLVRRGLVKGMAHITGGGITNNLPRILPEGISASIKLGSWKVPPIFHYVRETGNISCDEMRSTFNMGIGMILAVAAEDASTVRNELEAADERPYLIGELEEGERRVRYLERS